MSNSSKYIWFVGGGIEATPGIERAKEMGFKVVVSDGSPDAPGMKIADHSFIASTYDAEDTLLKAREFSEKISPISGIISVANDVPLTVATVASGLGLPGIPVSAAKLAMDKMAMKDCLKAANIPIPWYTEIKSEQHLIDIVKKRNQRLIIKPVDSRGARGVLQINPDLDLNWAYNHSLENSPSNRVMVEEFITGPQFSTEGLLIKKTPYPIAFIERNYEFLDKFKPYVIENGGQSPSSIDADIKTQIELTALKAGLALGVETGVIKGDMIWSKDGPIVVEIAPRLSGGYMSTHQVPLVTGVDLIGAAINLATGNKVDLESLKPKNLCGASNRYFFLDKGIVTSLDDPDKWLNGEKIILLHLGLKVGDKTSEPTNHTQRDGMVMTIGNTAIEAQIEAQKVINNFEIKLR